MEKNNNCFAVYSRKIAYKLIYDGFELVEEVPSLEYEGQSNYFFKGSPELVQKVKEYSEELKARKQKLNGAK